MIETDVRPPSVLERFEPPRPPRIPVGRRLRRAVFRAWPMFVWCAALAGAVYLYTGLADPGQALAHEEILSVRASPSVSGRIATLAVQLGASVEEGDPIATLDARDVDAQLRFARAKLERSRTRIAAVREEFEQDARDRRAQAAARRASYESEGRRIRLAIDRLAGEESADRAEVAALTPQIERLRPLTEGNLVTRDRLEGLVQTRTVTEARISSHAERIRTAREELALWEQLAPAAAVETDPAARLVPYELELEAQEARVAELLLEREKYTVRAPTTGVVSRVPARPGEWCDSGAEIVELVVTVPHRVTAYVLGAHARIVRPGTLARLHPRDRLAGTSLEGRVLGIGPRMELIPTQLRKFASVPEWGRRVSIEIENPEPPLPGEVYTVRFR